MFLITAIAVGMAYWYVGLFLGGIGSIVLIIMGRNDDYTWLEGKQNLVFTISTLFFAICHYHVIGSSSVGLNFLASLIAFAIPGFFFGYWRKEFGFAYAVGGHSLNNFMVLLINGLLY